MRLAGYILILFGALSLVLGVLAGPGCRRRISVEDSRQQMAESFGRLPGLTETPDPKLRAELARIIEEQATPELLAGHDVLDEENVAQGLAELFRASRVEAILDDSGRIFPSGKFAFSPTGLERAIRFRRQYETQRQDARKALRRPRCDFGIQYEAGFAADLAFVDVVHVCARLEAFHAAESLAADELPAAVESLEFMFRLAACLASEKHPTVRLQAATIRLEALAVLQAIVEHPEVSRPKITRAELGRLYALVESQLKAWPADRDAWIGDRALGMHSYELVRAGLLLELLTEEEAKRFAEEGILEDLPQAARRNVNSDELYYLQAMRKIIDACDQPYYQRTETFQSIRRDLHEKRNSPDFPPVAGRLLLVDMETGHAIQARDRASCEGWALALALASGHKRPPYQTSPLSGYEYGVARQDGLVKVWGIGPDENPDFPPVIVPDLAQQEREP